MPQRTAVLQLILYAAIKGGGVSGYVKPTGGRLGRWERAKQGTLWHWIKSKTNGRVLGRLGGVARLS